MPALLAGARLDERAFAHSVQNPRIVLFSTKNDRASSLWLEFRSELGKTIFYAEDLKPEGITVASRVCQSWKWPDITVALFAEAVRWRRLLAADAYVVM
jgi:hypothetical protein